MLQIGAVIPDLTVTDETGDTLSLHDVARGYWVLYFYPKDDTPGCTSEAAQFRDAYDDFKAKGAEIVGCSRDSVASHAKFKEKYGLPFRLLADADSAVCDAFGVIVEKNMYGKKAQGVARATFLVGPDKKIVRVWPKVAVGGHADEVLAAVP